MDRTPRSRSARSLPCSWCGGRGQPHQFGDHVRVYDDHGTCRSPEVGRRPHRAAFRKLQLNPAEGGEAGVNGPAEVLRGRLADRATQDVSSFLLHRAPVLGGAYAQAPFQPVVEVSDGDAGHWLAPRFDPQEVRHR